MTTSVWIHGIRGKMGTILRSEIAKKNSWHLLEGSDQSTSESEIVSGLEKSSLVIDFSSAEGNQSLLRAFKKLKVIPKAILICSTGLSSQQKSEWDPFQNTTRLMFAPNTSLGILMMMKSTLAILALSQKNNFDIEIEECHHRHKKDSPSGTSLFLAESLQKHIPNSIITSMRTEPRKDHEIGISCTRGGGVFGEHRIRFLGEFEEFTVSHRAFSRELFAKGSLVLSEWLLKQKPASYTLHDVDLNHL